MQVIIVGDSGMGALSYRPGAGGKDCAGSQGLCEGDAGGVFDIGRGGA